MWAVKYVTLLLEIIYFIETSGLRGGVQWHVSDVSLFWRGVEGDAECGVAVLHNWRNHALGALVVDSSCECVRDLGEPNWI